MTQLLVVPWGLFIIFVPGLLIITLLRKRGYLDFSFLETVLLSFAAGLLYIALIGYILDFCGCFGFLEITISTLSFNAIGIFFVRSYLIDYLRREDFSPNKFHWKNLTFYLGFFLIVSFVTILVLWAPLTNIFIYPSDPVTFLFRGRYLATEGQLVLLVLKASQGSAMTYPLGFDYLLASLFSLNLSNSFNVVRFLGPFFGILSVFSVYALTNRVTNSRTSSILAALFAGTNYMWVWFRKLSVPNGTVEFIIPIFFLSFYLLLKSESHKKLKVLYFLVAILAGAIWIFHPPTLLIFLIPTLIWYIFLGRKFISVWNIFRMLILFLAFTAPFWILLNQNSFGQRLTYTTTNEVVSPSSSYLSIDYMIQPFQDYWSFAPLIPLAFGILGYGYRKIKEKDHKSSLCIYEILIFTFIFQYLLWLTPIPTLRSFLLNQYYILRMPLHLSLAGSVLVGYGFKELSTLLKRYRLSEFVYKKKENAKSQSNGHSLRRFAGIIFIVMLLVTPIFFQAYWGYSKFERNIFRSKIREGSSLLVYWIDKNVPLNVTILLDDNNTPFLEEIIRNRFAEENLEIEGEVAKFWLNYTMLRELAGSIYERSPAYFSYAALYPRNIICFEHLFNTTQTGEIENFVHYIMDNKINYIILTNPESWSSLLTSLTEFTELTHTAEGVSLYEIDYERLEMKYGDIIYIE